VKKKRKTDPSTEELLSVAIAAVTAAKVDSYAIGGALAMEAHGYSRSTKDVDLFVLHEDAHAVLRALRMKGMTVTPVFAPHHYVATIPGTTDIERRIDVLVPSGEPELSAIEWAESKPLFGKNVLVFPVNLLAVAKGYSTRPEDETDLAAMLARGMFYPQEVSAIIATVDPDGAEQFDKLIGRIQKQRERRPKPTRRLKKNAWSRKS